MKKGVTRLVFLTGSYVLKIPNFTYSHQHFLNGMYANWSERQFSKSFKNLPEYEKIAPTIFCTWFGFLSIQKRVESLKFDIKTNLDLREQFKDICEDFKSENFGILNDKIVCIDYV